MPTQCHELRVGIVCEERHDMLFVLPLAIYWVGREMIGSYSTDASAGALTLAESIWADLLRFRLAAWVLVLAPYASVQLLRLTRRLWRAAPL